MKFPVVAYCQVSPKGQSCNEKSDKDNKCHGMNINQIDDNVIVYYGKTIISSWFMVFLYMKKQILQMDVKVQDAFNPQSYHGSSNSEIRHVDLGNIESNENGVAKGLIKLNKSGIKLYGPPELSIVNDIMIHEGEDIWVGKDY